MASKRLGSLKLALMEAFSSARLQRRPEPAPVMDDPASVRAFHDQGSSIGPLLPVYHFNALCTSRLAPENGFVVDLGSGSGQYLAYLARRRPDLRILGLDLSEQMVDLGRQYLRAEGFADRVDLRIGDMTDFSMGLQASVDVMSSVFSLHHLPTRGHLDQCLGEIAAVRKASGSALWIFDHARPRNPRTPREFPEVFTPSADPVFRTDSCNSLIASFSFGELMGALHGSGQLDVQHQLAKILPLYQIHWSEGPRSSARAHALWQDTALPREVEADFRGLKRLFPRAPLPNP